MVGAQLEAPVTAPGAAAAGRAHGARGHRLAHRALPGRDLAEVELATRAPRGRAGRAARASTCPPARAAAPFARAATEQGLALIVGEEAARLHDRPPLLLVALPGRALLDGPEPAERLVALTGADGLVVELDPVGEALASGGRVAARASTSRRRARALAPLPVVVREAGSGLDGADARALQALGAAAVDVGGAGARPAGDPAFAGWGVTLAEAVAEAALMAPGPAAHRGRAAARRRAGGDVPRARRDRRGAAARTPRHDAAEAVAAVLHQLRVAVWACGAPSAAALHPGLLR